MTRGILPHGSTWPRLTAWTLAIMLGASLPLLGADNSKEAKEVKLIRQNACAALQTDFDSAAARLAGDARFQAYQERLARLEAVATQILKDLTIYRAAFIKRNLATIGNSADESTAKPVEALKLMADNQAALSSPLPLPGGDADQKLLLTYYDTALAAIKKVILSRAQENARDKEMAEIQRLAFVLPLLHCTDETGDREVEQVPAWLKRPDTAAVLEEFALNFRRPLTAYVLSKLATPAGAAEKDPNAYVNYVEKAADKALRSKDYPGGLQLLNAASQSAALANLSDRYMELRFRIAEVNSATGATRKAIEELEQIKRAAPVDQVYGKAAMLHLKYMYGAGNFKQILIDTLAYRNDKRCESYIPQILYISWLASQRIDGGDSEALQNEFLERFPEHSLGAEFYFSSAMKSLAASNYDEALRILQFIESRYPGSALISRVKDISQRLSKNKTTPDSAKSEAPK